MPFKGNKPPPPKYAFAECRNNHMVGIVVDQRFYNSPFKYWDGTDVKQKIGSEISRPVTIFEYESDENEKKREIFLLKPRYLDAFLSDFRKTNLYGKSSDFINNRLKKTGV